MKPIIGIISLLILTTFLGCKKSNDPERKKLSEPTTIIGTWELRKTSGGMMPGFKSYANGNGNLFKFKQGGGYEIYEGGILSVSGTYSLVADTNIEASVCLVFPKDQYQTRVVFDGNNTRKPFFQVFNSNKLVFYEGCYALDGGHSEEYERK